MANERRLTAAINRPSALMFASAGANSYAPRYLSVDLDQPNGRIWRILLKKSRIEGLRKSRECRMLAISAAARLCSIDASVGGGVCVSRCGPSNRRA
jgi:hypothetical protein